MRTFGLTAEQTTAAAHVVGLVGAALVILASVLTGVLAFLANWKRTTAIDPVTDGWVPSGMLVSLCIGLIVGASVNDFLNTPKPATVGTTSTTSSVQTSSTREIAPSASAGGSTL